MYIRTPRLEIYTNRIKVNAQAVIDLCRRHGAQVACVTKVMGAHPALLQALAQWLTPQDPCVAYLRAALEKERAEALIRRHVPLQSAAPESPSPMPPPQREAFEQALQVLLQGYLNRPGI